MLSHDGSHDNEAEYPAGFCALPLLLQQHRLLERRGPQRSCGASVPPEAVKFGLSTLGEQSPLCSVSQVLGEMVGSCKGHAPLGFWICLIRVDREAEAACQS